MAGGRRPANYAAGTATRHVPAERDATANSYYSIWQQPPPLPTSTSPPTAIRVPQVTALPPLDGHRLASLAPCAPPEALARDTAEWSAASNPSSALAAALDAAVTMAVQRALTSSTISSPFGTHSRANRDSFPSSPFGQNAQDDQDHAQSVASSSFNHVVGDESRSNSANGDREREKDRDWANIVELHIESESQERKKEAEDLRSALANLEGRFVESEASHAAIVSDLESRIDSAEAAAAEAKSEAKRHAADAASLRDQMRSIEKIVVDNRALKRKADSDSDRMRSRMAHFESLFNNVEEALVSLQKRLDHVEGAAAKVANLMTDMEHAKTSASDLANAVASAKKALRTSTEALEAASGLRPRLKRLETVVEATGKRADESLALQGGCLDSLRLSITETSASVQALKRLVEANLRSHSSAEGIVKDQAQLITRHVCVALRQFISRRIIDNNILIDKTLRARVPAYAEAGDEFVLVREHDVEPEDETETVTSTATSAVRRANSTVIPREVFDRAIADFDANVEVHGERAR